MQLPDEAVSYSCHNLLVPPNEDWTAAAELRSQHFLHPNLLKEAARRVELAKSHVAAERELRAASADSGPVGSGFIDLPQALLDGYRRKGDASELGRIIGRAARLREQADSLVVLGSAGDGLAGRVLVEALKSSHHNELPSETRMGVPRLWFAGDNLDNDSLQELRDLLEVTCVDPGSREERWGVVVVSRSGTSLDTMAALRVFRRDATEYYGHRSEWLRELFQGVTAPASPLRDMLKAEGHADEDVLAIPDHVGGNYGILTAAGLLPAALAGLDVRALLMGAAAMTRRFLEESFDRNPVLQMAAVNWLACEELGKPVRALAIWSKKLAALGKWHDLLVSSSLGKQGGGPTPMSMVLTGDLAARGQQQQDGPRDRFTTHLAVRAPQKTPIAVQMADRNEDGLNAYARKTFPELTAATLQGFQHVQLEVARPAAELVVPALSEHTMGQLLQLLMLSTVVEARLHGVNPYAEPGLDAIRRSTLHILKG